MLYRWEVILIKNLICVFVYFFGHKWIPEKFFGKGKKQLTRSQVILTARTRVAINNQLFMTKLLQLPCRSLSPEKGTNLWATPHDHLWLYVIFISTCHQDNSLILNGGSRNILQKALQEIPLKKAKQREKILEKEEKQYKTDSWKRRLN